jgi:hypothetical protein
MIKCGAIAAVVIAGSAAGTATLISDPAGTEDVAATRSSANMEVITTRGTRSSSSVVDPFASAIGDQPRRGARSDVQPVSVAMTAPTGDGVRRGTR